MRLLISVLAGVFSVLAGVLLAVALAYAQQVNSWSLGGFTINVPLTNPVVTVQSPSRSGTLALKEDIVAGPQALEAKGIITLANGVGSVALAGFTVAPICVVSDPSGNSVKYSSTISLLSVAGVGPTAAYHCK